MSNNVLALDENTTLQAQLTAATTGNDPTFSVTYVDSDATTRTVTEETVVGTLNGLTVVTMLTAAPNATTKRVIKDIRIHNQSTTSSLFWVRVNDGTGRRIDQVEFDVGDTWTLNGVYALGKLKTANQEGNNQSDSVPNKSILIDAVSTLQVNLAGAVTTNQLELYFGYTTENLTTGNKSKAATYDFTNNTTAVTVVPSPSSGSANVLTNANILNADTIQHTVSIFIDDTVDNFFIDNVSLAPGDRWTLDGVYNSSGQLKTTNSITNTVVTATSPFTTNEQTLAGTKTLTGADPILQKLDPNGANRDVVLPDPPTTDDYFEIIHDGTADQLLIKETAAGAVQATLDPPTTSGNIFLARCIRFASEWLIITQAVS